MTPGYEDDGGMAAHCWEWHNDTIARLDPPLPTSRRPPPPVHITAVAIADAIRAARDSRP